MNRLGVTVALAAVLVAGFAPVSATAAAGEVQLSPDGVTFSSGYTGALFDGIGHFVPGDTDQQTFYVRNGGTEPGHLRLTLRDVMVTDADFADALTVSATTSGQTGTAVAVSTATPCRVLSEGQVLAPGQVVQVTAMLTLGDLDGQAGQGATAALGLGVGLSSAGVQLPATECGKNFATIPVISPPRSSASQPFTPALPGATGGTGVLPPASNPPAADLPVLGLPGILGIDPNTWRLFEEYFVFLLIGAFVAGTAWFAFVAWRRRKNEPEPDEGGTTG